MRPRHCLDIKSGKKIVKGARIAAENSADRLSHPGEFHVFFLLRVRPADLAPNSSSTRKVTYIAILTVRSKCTVLLKLNTVDYIC